MVQQLYSVRDCAQSLLRAIERCGDDGERLCAEMREPMRRLMERDDLLTLGVPRQGNNVAVSHYLYFDGQLTIIVFQVPKGKPIQPHDHGTWESLFVYRGKLDHTVFSRVDDGARPGHADLKVVRSGTLERGDGVVVAPPNDIHGFTALTDDTYGVTVVSGEYKPDRHYYNPAEGTYVVRGQRSAR
jgi:predicted metal-dependent enzyme (double-stranded beta helix superfamily)